MIDAPNRFRNIQNDPLSPLPLRFDRPELRAILCSHARPIRHHAPDFSRSPIWVCVCFTTKRPLRGRSPNASYTGGSGQRGGAEQPRGLYVDRKGVVKDEKREVEWMRKAGEQGDANGQDSLNEMYCDGRGVQQDNVGAYMWFNLVVDNI